MYVGLSLCKSTKSKQKLNKYRHRKSDLVTRVHFLPTINNIEIQVKGVQHIFIAIKAYLRVRWHDSDCMLSLSTICIAWSICFSIQRTVQRCSIGSSVELLDCLLF